MTDNVIMPNSLVQGDCLDLMNRIEPGTVDFIFADVPYQTIAAKWDLKIPLNRHILIRKGKKLIPLYKPEFILNSYRDGIPYDEALETFESIAEDGMWQHFKRILKPNGVVAMTGSQPFTGELSESNRGWYRSDWAWDKGVGANFMNLKNRPSKTKEDVIIFSRGADIVFNPKRVARSESSLKKMPVGYAPKSTVAQTKGHYGVEQPPGYKQNPVDGKKHPVDIIKFMSRQDQSVDCYNSPYKHPTRKPVELIEYLIRTYTKVGALVFDPTMGVGTTPTACVRTYRNYIGFEMDESYFNLAVQRVAEEEIKIKHQFRILNEHLEEDNKL